jgi:hypothetical protein
MTIETPQTSTPTPTPTPALEASAAAIPAPDPAAAERATARAKRIAAAVERGKREYQPEHAYTERGWFLETEAAGPSKADRQRVEYAATHRLVFPASTSESEEGGEIQEARRALADILACTPKPASLPRELVATGARAAILAGDAEAAITLARAGRTHWRQPGMAVVCSSALEYAGELEGAYKFRRWR